MMGCRRSRGRAGGARRHCCQRRAAASEIPEASTVNGLRLEGSQAGTPPGAAAVLPRYTHRHVQRTQVMRCPLRRPARLLGLSGPAFAAAHGGIAVAHIGIS